MGCAQSTATGVAASPQEVANSRAIDDDLVRAKKEDAKVSKCLLLGPGESGKSTIVKQLRLCYAEPWTEKERASYREIVFANTLRSAQAVVSAFPLLAIELSAQLADPADYLVEIDLDDAVDPLTNGLRQEVAEALKVFVRDDATNEAVRQSAKFQLNDSAEYFFAAIDRICDPSYLPSVQDVLRSRVRSTGIVEERFDVGGGKKLLVVDVGGQRSERKKWIHCFENVNILLFVVAVSEYDQMLFEDQRVSRVGTPAKWFEQAPKELLGILLLAASEPGDSESRREGTVPVVG